MSFTTRCFIRKNSKELQKNLADIGYSICRCANFANAEWLNTLPINGTVHGKGYLDVEMEFPDLTVEKELNRFVNENPNYIDCGTNEELFLAISALRDDSDKNQWFVDDNIGKDWIKSDTAQLCDLWIGEPDLDDPFRTEFENEGYQPFPYHKATVEELINHFK